MYSEMKNTIHATDQDAQYDECAKRLLGQKIILAHILVHAVDEFRGMKAEDVVSYIEGDPYISVVPVDPGMTNRAFEKEGERVVGFNSENQELYEGLIRFDIIFYVRLKDGISQMIINIEAQRKEPAEYHILNRAVFYTCRMISSQKERDFTNSNYNDIKRVYSIWVCMNMKENSLEHVHLQKDSFINSHNWKGNMELFNIIMIGLSEEVPEADKKYELHRLIGALLSKTLTPQEKENIMEEEYKIPMERQLREEVDIMCNLSQDIREEATEATTLKFILRMDSQGYTKAQIAGVADMDEKEVEEILSNAKTQQA